MGLNDWPPEGVRGLWRPMDRKKGNIVVWAWGTSRAAVNQSGCSTLEGKFCPWGVGGLGQGTAESGNPMETGLWKWLACSALVFIVLSQREHYARLLADDNQALLYGLLGWANLSGLSPHGSLASLEGLQTGEEELWDVLCVTTHSTQGHIVQWLSVQELCSRCDRVAVVLLAAGTPLSLSTELGAARRSPWFPQVAAMGLWKSNITALYWATKLHPLHPKMSHFGELAGIRWGQGANTVLN